MEAKLAEAGSRFASRHALEFQREAARCKTEIDTMQRELLNVKLEVRFIKPVICFRYDFGINLSIFLAE